MIQLSEIEITNDLKCKGIPAFKCGLIDFAIISGIPFEFELGIQHFKYESVCKLLQTSYLHSNPLNRVFKQSTMKYDSRHTNLSLGHIYHNNNVKYYMGMLVEADHPVKIKTDYLVVDANNERLYSIYQKDYCYYIDVIMSLCHCNILCSTAATSLPMDVSEIIYEFYEKLTHFNKLYYLPRYMSSRKFLSCGQGSSSSDHDFWKLPNHEFWKLLNAQSSVEDLSGNVYIILSNPAHVTIHTLRSKRIKYEKRVDNFFSF